MTREKREQLIRHLKYNLNIGADYLITDEDAVEIIKALEQEPSTDAISRQAAVDFLETHAETYEDVRVKMGFKASASLINNRNNLPPVNPQTKTGHWKQISPAKIYECSVCGQNVMTNDIFCYKYCHGCGAKMVEPQESEEEG